MKKAKPKKTIDVKEFISKKENIDKARELIQQLSIILTDGNLDNLQKTFTSDAVLLSTGMKKDEIFAVLNMLRLFEFVDFLQEDRDQIEFVIKLTKKDVVINILETILINLEHLKESTRNYIETIDSFDDEAKKKAIDHIKLSLSDFSLMFNN